MQMKSEKKGQCATVYILFTQFMLSLSFLWHSQLPLVRKFHALHTVIPYMAVIHHKHVHVPVDYTCMSDHNIYTCSVVVHTSSCWYIHTPLHQQINTLVFSLPLPTSFLAICSPLDQSSHNSQSTRIHIIPILHGATTT